MASLQATDTPVTNVTVEKKLDESVRSKIDGDVFLHVQIDALSNVQTGGRLPSFQVNLEVRGAKAQTTVVPKKVNAEFFQRFAFAFPNGVGDRDELVLSLVDATGGKKTAFAKACIGLNGIDAHAKYDFSGAKKICVVKDSKIRANVDVIFAITTSPDFPDWAELYDASAPPASSRKTSKPSKGDKTPLVSQGSGVAATGGRQRSGTLQRLKRSMSVRFGKGDKSDSPRGAAPFLDARSASLSTSSAAAAGQGKRRNSLFARLRGGSRASLVGNMKSGENGSASWRMERSRTLTMAPPVMEQATAGQWSTKFRCDCGHGFEHRVTYVTHIKYCRWYGRKAELEKAKEDYEALQKATPAEAAALFSSGDSSPVAPAAAAAATVPASSSQPATASKGAGLAIDTSQPPPQLRSGNYEAKYICDCGHQFQYPLSFKTHVKTCKFFTGDRSTPHASKKKKDQQRMKQSLLQAGATSDDHKLPVSAAADTPKPPVNPEPTPTPPPAPTPTPAPEPAPTSEVTPNGHDADHPMTNGNTAGASTSPNAAVESLTPAPAATTSTSSETTSSSKAAPDSTPEADAGSLGSATRSKKKRKRSKKKKGSKAGGSSGAAVV